MKAASHSGASKRSISSSSIISPSSISTRGNGSAGNPGAVAPGHSFWGNQHTGSLGKQNKVKGQVKQAQSKIGKVPPQAPVGGAAASIIASAAGAPAAVQATAAQSAAAKALAASQSQAYYAQQAAQQKIAQNNAVANATASYNTAKDTVGQTQKQQAQNVAFTVAQTKNTASASQNELGQQKIAAVKLQADNAQQQAEDRLKNSQVQLMGAMKAAGFRAEELEGLDELEMEELERDGMGFVGEGAPPGVNNPSGTAALLPVGPSAKQDKRIRKRLKEPETRPTDRNPDTTTSTHWFQGSNRNSCEKCGEPMTSPKHEQVDEHGAMGPATINKSASTGLTKQAGYNFPLQGREDDGFIAAPEDPDSPWHTFDGDDLTHCDVCGGAIQEPQHLKGGGQGEQVQEAAESAPGVPPVAIPDQEDIIRSASSTSDAHEANLKNVAVCEGPLENDLVTHFEEQKRATINRLLGKRGGRMLKRAAIEMEDVRRRLSKPLDRLHWRWRRELTGRARAPEEGEEEKRRSER